MNRSIFQLACFIGLFLTSTFLRAQQGPNDQQSIPAISGSPENKMKARTGFLVEDELLGRLFIKRSPPELASGWSEVGTGGTNVSSDLNWTNSAGVIKLVTQTNHVTLGDDSDYPSSAQLWLRGTITNGQSGLGVVPNMDSLTSAANPTAIYVEESQGSVNGVGLDQPVGGFAYITANNAARSSLNANLASGWFGWRTGGNSTNNIGGSAAIMGRNDGIDAVKYGAFGLVLNAADNGQTNVGVGGLVDMRAHTAPSAAAYFYGAADGGDGQAHEPQITTSGILFADNADTGLPVIIVRTNQNPVFDVDASGHTIVGRLLISESGRVINRFATATNYTLTVANHWLTCTAPQTNFLPAANAVAAGQIFVIKTLGNTNIVRPAGVDTIDLVAGDDTLTNKMARTYMSNGVNGWETK